LVSEDGSAAICPREEKGSLKLCGDAGYLHILWRPPELATGTRSVVLRQRAVARNDIGVLAQIYEKHADKKQLDSLSASLGLTASSLRRLGVGRMSGYAWTFPMSEPDGRAVGLRLRLEDGSKISLSGSRNGLFIPKDLGNPEMLFVAEGPTDTAALLDLGFSAVGRPSCNSGTRHLTELLGRLRPNTTIIVADGDTPGQVGAKSLASALSVHVQHIRIITPPSGNKDVRAWKQAGAMATDILSAIDQSLDLGVAIKIVRTGQGGAH